MLINVSDINRYVFCPRTIYFSNVLKIAPKLSIEQEKGILGHAIRKEFSLRQAKIIAKIKDIDEIRPILMEELGNILRDIPHIYREKIETIEIEKILPEIKPEIVEEIKIMEKRVRATIEKFGITEALRRVTPWKVEFSLRSERMKLSGRVDKVMKDESYFPIEIKTGNPAESIWDADRLQVCAYAMLLEEKLNVRIPYGFVEYTRIQERRPVMTSEKLRRNVLYTRDKIFEILSGELPEICPHGSGKKCESCGFKDVCYEV
ncbi:MAG: CRISPR-associated protein Cas4 [Candidatus Altiarchaeota archaeon]